MLVAQVSFSKAGENNVSDAALSGAAKSGAAASTAAVCTQGQPGRDAVANVSGADRTGLAPSNPSQSKLSVIVTPAIGYAWVGDKVTITAVAIGSKPLGYQWFRDGQPIAGATQSRFELTEVQLTNSGTYTVLVTNMHGFDMGTSSLNVETASSPQVMLATNSEIKN